MLCRYCGINNPNANKVCFHCKSPLVDISELEIDSHLDEGHAKFRRSKNTLLRYHLIKKNLQEAYQSFMASNRLLGRPWLAAWLSIIPGLGQIYNGQSKKAIPFLLVSITLVALFIINFYRNISNLFCYLYAGNIIVAFMDAFTTSIINNKRGKVSQRQFISLFFYGLFVIGITLLTLQWYLHGLFQLSNINNNSLKPFLLKGDRVCINKVDLWFHPPKRGDKVFYSIPVFSAQDSDDNLYLFGDGTYIERIIGLPTETVLFHESKIYINGRPLAPDLYPMETNNFPAELKFDLSSTEYFILLSTIPQPGDTIVDKFSIMIGMPSKHNAVIRTQENWRKACVIKKDKIIGKPWFIYDPAPRRRFL